MTSKARSHDNDHDVRKGASTSSVSQDNFPRKEGLCYKTTAPTEDNLRIEKWNDAIKSREQVH